MTEYNRIPVLAEARADLYTPLARVRAARPRALFVPARVRGRRRALRPLLVHRPAPAPSASRRAGARCAGCCATRAARDVVPREREHGDPFEYVRGWLEAPSRAAAAGAAALRRRPGRLFRLRGRAAHRADGARRGQARSARHAGHRCSSSRTSSRWSTTCSASSTSSSTPIRGSRMRCGRKARLAEAAGAPGATAAAGAARQAAPARPPAARRRRNARSPKRNSSQAVGARRSTSSPAT